MQSGGGVETGGRPALIRPPVRQGEAVHFQVQIPDPAAAAERLRQWARGVQLRHLREAAARYQGAAWARYEDAKKADHQAEQVRAQAQAALARAHQSRGFAAMVGAKLDIPGHQVLDEQRKWEEDAAQAERAAAHYQRQHQELTQRAQSYRHAARSALRQIATAAAEAAAREVDATCQDYLDRWVALCPAAALFSYDVIGPHVVEELANDLEREGPKAAGPWTGMPASTPKADTQELLDRVQKEAGGIMFDGSNAAQAQAVIDNYFREHGLPAPSEAARPRPGINQPTPEEYAARPQLIRDEYGTVYQVVGWLDGHPVVKDEGKPRLVESNWRPYVKGPAARPQPDGQPDPPPFAPVPFHQDWPPQPADPPHPLLTEQFQRAADLGAQAGLGQVPQYDQQLPVPNPSLVNADADLAAYIAQVQAASGGVPSQQFVEMAKKAQQQLQGHAQVPYQPGGPLSPQGVRQLMARPNNDGVRPGLPPGMRSPDLMPGQVREVNPNEFPQ